MKCFLPILAAFLFAPVTLTAAPPAGDGDLRTLRVFIFAGQSNMFDPKFKPEYGKNLKNFVASWRRDLKTPQLKFYIGELCTKTVRGMDNRENMYAIREGQKSVTESDPLAEYIPTSHNAVEIGGGEGLHYHYGTLGQFEHGVNYADAYLRTIGETRGLTPSMSPETSPPSPPRTRRSFTSRPSISRRGTKNWSSPHRASSNWASCSPAVISKAGDPLKWKPHCGFRPNHAHLYS